jgi:hypothetical protein
MHELFRDLRDGHETCKHGGTSGCSGVIPDPETGAPPIGSLSLVVVGGKFSFTGKHSGFTMSQLLQIEKPGNIRCPGMMQYSGTSKGMGSHCRYGHVGKALQIQGKNWF